MEVIRFRYMVPTRMQALACPTILPNLKRRPWLLAQVPAFLLAQYWAACRLIRTQGVDLVYAHWVMPQGLIATLLKRRTGVPYVLQNHSSDLRVFSKIGRAGKAIACRILRSANHLFCVNRDQQAYALSLFPDAEQRQLRARTSVLPMGVTSNGW